MDHRRLVVPGIAGTVAFAAAHVYWAAGGRVGVPAAAPPIGERPVFLAYDLVSAVVLVTAAVLARGLLASAPDPKLLRLATVGAVLALVRGGIGLVQDTATAVGGHSSGIGTVYDLWFAVTGVLFLVVVRGHATGTTSSRSTMSPVAPARTPRRPSTST